MKTLTEKYRGVLNETFNKTQFVRDARMAMPNLISQFNGFEDTVSILKSKGMISEKADEKALKHHNLSDEAIRRGADIEIEEMGRMSQDSVSLEDQAKAKDKALANLIKDPLHYLNIMAGESSKVDKHDKPVEYAKGKEVDTFNGMKKVELKENYTKDTLIKALGSADDAFIQLRDGRELIIYNPNSNNDDNAAMWHDDTVFAVDQDGQEEEIDYRDITNAYLEGKLSEAEPIPTEPGQTKIGDDGKEYGVRASNHDRKMAMRKVIDALTITGDDKGFKVSTDQALEFIRTHKDDIFSGDIDTEDVEDIWMNYNEYESVNYETGSDFVQEIEIDEEEVEEAMTDQEMKDIEKYGQKDDIVKPYRPGAMFTSDFDYEGMLEAGLKVRLNTPIETLQAIEASMTDVNYHTEASHLSYAIDAIQEKDKVEALDHLRNFRKEIKKTLVSFNEGVSPTRELAEGVIKETAFKSKTYGRKPNTKIAEGRRKKTKGGKVVTENDYETGGYVESMGPMFDKGVNFLIRAWEEWKMGPMTEPGMIEFAKKDVISYLETQFMVENLEEKKGKDLDGDGDVDGDDYKHAKDSAIKKALNKDEKLVKENLKSIISKVLEEGIVNEAATNKLADWGTSYETFPGVKPVVNSLENIVTEIEQFYDKIGDKIADTFSKTSEFKNEEGLNIGAFIAPSLESAFKQDLRPVVKGGFIKKVVLPKVKTITKREIDRYDVGVPDIGTEMDEDEKQTVYSAPVNGTLN
jgi:hypothetical protein|tara:strand:+ start:3921 stop:6164 length:2244 start_codon:yes stop_codon:yes gene_type:complete